MKALIACERFGAVRDAFIRRAGHEAWSCDVSDPAPDGAWPALHLYGDALGFLDRAPGGGAWDLMIAFPPCTYLTNSAAWAFKDPDFHRYPNGGYHQKVKPGTLVGRKRREARAEALDFVQRLMRAPIPRIAIENPEGCIGTRIDMTGWDRQTIQPYQFGHDASKGTVLWLRGLPPLRPTKYVPPRIVNGRPRWANQTDSGQNRLSPSEDRAALRGKTYDGIAAAMADQWA